jgi:hypothetical protein
MKQIINKHTLIKVVRLRTGIITEQWKNLETGIIKIITL